MSNFWRVQQFAVLFVAMGLLMPSSKMGAAQAPTQLAGVMKGSLKSAASENPSLQQVKHNLCGVGLGGHCSRKYRGCVRSGKPKAECKKLNEQCSACGQAMVACRQKVGHAKGYTCEKCRSALEVCRGW